MVEVMPTKKNLDKISIIDQLRSIKIHRPLIHNITNYVAMEISANALLALGASPIMTAAVDELEEVVNLAQALVINIGTLDTELLNSISLAQKLAVKLGLPIVFDPVGVGASRLRYQAAEQILQQGVHIVRGNASEILFLANKRNANANKGVDSLHESQEAIDAARLINQRYQCCVAISGATDYVVDGQQITTSSHGSEYATRVTGMGCVSTALIGAFAAVNPDRVSATSHAMVAFGLAQEYAAKLAQGPGTFLPHVLDGLYNLSEQPSPQLKIIQHYAVQ